MSPNNYFKIAVHNFVFFDGCSKDDTQKAYDQALRTREKKGGPVAVWRAIPLSGAWSKVPVIDERGAS
jgi:hypothetical protein